MQIKLPYIHFMTYSRNGLWLSTILTVAAILLIAFRGFNFGLEFTGGATIEMQYAQSADINHVRSVAEKIVPDAGVAAGSARGAGAGALPGADAVTDAADEAPSTLV